MEPSTKRAILSVLEKGKMTAACGHAVTRENASLGLEPWIRKLRDSALFFAPLTQ